MARAKEGDKRLGNQFWRLRSKHGRDKLFVTPELLWEAACEYFQWCEDNPLKEEKAFHTNGVITKTDVSKMRAMTLSQLCFYLDCNEAYFRQFKEAIKDSDRQIDIDFSTVISKIESTIYNQKFQGASADLLNANIIARDLGLHENINQKNTVITGIEVTYTHGDNTDKADGEAVRSVEGP